MAVNDPRVADRQGTIRRFQMWRTFDIAEDTSREEIISEIKRTARSASGGMLNNLVLSCHGLPGYLQLGAGFDRTHIPLLAGLKGLVYKIWLPDCLVAHMPDAAERERIAQNYPGMNSSDGSIFCSNLAQTTGAYVVASTGIQCEEMRDVPYGMMTSFEGLIVSFDPQGRVSWYSRNPSAELNENGQCVSYVPD